MLARLQRKDTPKLCVTLMLSPINKIRYIIPNESILIAEIEPAEQGRGEIDPAHHAVDGAGYDVFG